MITDEERRQRALELAVELQKHRSDTFSDQTVRTARKFETYLKGNG